VDRVRPVYSPGWDNGADAGFFCFGPSVGICSDKTGDKHSSYTLSVLAGDNVVKTYPVAAGKPSAPTPVGKFG